MHTDLTIRQVFKAQAGIEPTTSRLIVGTKARKKRLVVYQLVPNNMCFPEEDETILTTKLVRETIK